LYAQRYPDIGPAPITNYVSRTFHITNRTSFEPKIWSTKSAIETFNYNR